MIWILIGILILIVAIPSNTKNYQTTTSNAKEQNSSLEEKLEGVLSATEGVGKVKVMISTQKGESILFGSENGEEIVMGVVVVAQGAGNPVVDARISEVVKALFSIDVHKISIVKMTELEEEE